MKTISVVIPVWNGAALLGACLASLIPQLQAGDEIIVVDNGSSDGTPELVERDFPQVQVLRLGENFGYGGGANRGIAQAHGEAVLILNHDVTFYAGCVAALRRRLEISGPSILGCKLLYPDGRTIQHAGGIIAFPRATPDHYGYRQPDDGSWDSVREVDYVIGALFVIDCEVLNTIGAFDEEFFPLYYEEADYCFRARAAGFRVIYDPAAVAIHHESQTQDRRSRSYEQAMHRHRLRFVIKNYTAEQLRNHFFPAEMDWLHAQPVEFTRSIMAHAYYRTLLSVRDPAWLIRSARPDRDHWIAAAMAPAELKVHLKALYFAAVRPHEPPSLIWDARRQGVLDNL